MLIWRLMRRWMYLTGLDPEQIQEWAEEDDTNHPKAFCRLSREALGREVELHRATLGELLQVRALLRDRVTTLQKTPRAIANDWYPDGWRQAMGGLDAANEGEQRR